MLEVETLMQIDKCKREVEALADRNDVAMKRALQRVVRAARLHELTVINNQLEDARGELISKL